MVAILQLMHDLTALPQEASAAQDGDFVYSLSGTHWWLRSPDTPVPAGTWSSPPP